MQKLGLLTLAPRPAPLTGAGADLLGVSPTDIDDHTGPLRLRKVGLHSYASDRPYRLGYDVILARWSETGRSRAGRTKLRKIGLLTLS